MDEKLYVIGIGNPFDGVKLYGPFTQDQAEEFGDSCQDCEWWQVELEKP